MKTRVFHNPIGRYAGATRKSRRQETRPCARGEALRRNSGSEQSGTGLLHRPYRNANTRASGVRPPTGFKLANTVRVPCLRRRAHYLANENGKEN